MYCGRTQCLYTRCSDGWASRRWRVTVTFYCAVHLASRPTPLTAWSTNALGERASNVLGRCTRDLRRQDSGLHSPPIDPGLLRFDSATFSLPDCWLTAPRRGWTRCSCDCSPGEARCANCVHRLRSYTRACGLIVFFSLSTARLRSARFYRTQDGHGQPSASLNCRLLAVIKAEQAKLYRAGLPS